jgi:hypothetical protein
MIELAFGIFSNLKNYRVQAVPDPAVGAMLHGKIRTLVGVIRMKENLLYFLEADSAFRVASKAFALSVIEMESHKV